MFHLGHGCTLPPPHCQDHGEQGGSFPLPPPLVRCPNHEDVSIQGLRTDPDPDAARQGEQTLNGPSVRSLRARPPNSPTCFPSAAYLRMTYMTRQFPSSPPMQTAR